MGISNKRAAFVTEYIRDFNATQAAIRAGYAARSARQQANRMLTKDDIKAAIKAHLVEKAMSADEVIARLTSIARGSMEDFMTVGSMSYSLDLEKAKKNGVLHLIRKIKDRTVMTRSKDGEETETHTLEIELYDAHAALADLGRYHALFTDNTEVHATGELLIKWEDGA